MRRAALVRSVRRFIREDEDLLAVAYIWSRHRLMLPYVAVAFLVLLGVAVAAGFDTWPTRLVIAGAGAGVALSATSNYRVLARTTAGLVLCRGSRIRQTAVGLVERLPDDTPIELVGSNLIISDWQVGGRRYSTTRNAGEAMRAVATLR